jgi:hypothetical protein
MGNDALLFVCDDNDLQYIHTYIHTHIHTHNATWCDERMVQRMVYCSGRVRRVTIIHILPSSRMQMIKL